ncbi:MAG: glycoside hydrolase family 88 protein [Defluviitaleaceae bacterium]|nr:glycoside hydrolase family 88 protein [Defluviitaleaceae bacterium]
MQTFTLAKHLSRRFCPETMKWMWGQGLLNYAFAMIDEAHNTDYFTNFLCRYYNAHIARGYRIVSSDTAAPGLGAFLLWKKTGNPAYLRIAKDVAKYMREAKPIIAHLPNHHGTGIHAYTYPQSIWIDSIMMYGVFASRYGSQQGDAVLVDYAKKQAAVFAKYLRDETSGLFYHSYWTKLKCPYPSKPMFWGRGNGWVMAAIPLLLQYLPEGDDKDATVEVFFRLAKALRGHQRDDGFFETLLQPRPSYKEASATALIATGFMYGARTGILDKSYALAGKKAFEAVDQSIRKDKHGLCLPNISAPTIPVPLAPRLGYLLTPRGSNLTYGVAAAIFAALEYERLP